MRRKPTQTPLGQRIEKNGQIVSLVPGLRLCLERGRLLTASITGCSIHWDNNDDKFLFEYINNKENFEKLLSFLAVLSGLRFEFLNYVGSEKCPAYAFRELFSLDKPYMIQHGSQMVFDPMEQRVTILKKNRIITGPNGEESFHLPFIGGWKGFFDLVLLVADHFGLHYKKDDMPDFGTPTAIAFRFFK